MTNYPAGLYVPGGTNSGYNRKERWADKIDNKDLTYVVNSKSLDEQKEKEKILLKNSVDHIILEDESFFLFGNGGKAIAYRGPQEIYCTEEIEDKIKKWFGFEGNSKDQDCRMIVGSQRTPSEQRKYIKRTMQR